MFTFLLVVHAIIAAALVAVILMQRSEGGGLGMGGSPTGLMSARGAADFLTRATTILATLFVVMSIGLAVLASVQGGRRTIDTSLSRAPGAPGGLAPAAPAVGSGVPLAGDPLAGVAQSAGNVVAPLAPVVPAAPSAGGTAPATSAAPTVVPAAPANRRPRPARPSGDAGTAAPAAAPAPAPAASVTPAPDDPAPGASAPSSGATPPTP
jgi:preprotein translocase subunit SecG